MGNEKVLSVEERQKAYLAEINAKVSAKGYIAFIVCVIFFSGLCAYLPKFISWFDYLTLLGKFGKFDTIKDITGSGGTGSRNGFMLALTIVPSSALATGVVNVVEGLGGLRAGMKMLNPILKPVLGVPGWTGLAFIAHLFASTDTGSALTLELVNNELINEQELGIFSCFMFTATGFVGQALSFAGFFLPGISSIGCPVGYILLVGIIGKLISGNLMRLYIKLFDNKKKEVAAA